MTQLLRIQKQEKELAEMQAKWNSAQNDQIAVLRPLIHDRQNSTFARYLSARVCSWIHETAELYESRGAHYKDGKTLFCVYAPRAQKVECLLGSISQVIVDKLDMVRQPDGTWTALTEKAPPKTTYRYRVTDCYGCVKDRLDPFSFETKCISAPNQETTLTLQSVVVERNTFKWSDKEKDWCAARTTSVLKLSIYEVHIKSWHKEKKGNVREIADDLAKHCQEMGFTHIELYGIMDHYNIFEHGYQVSNFFAPYNLAGSYDDIQYFVDYMHFRNIGVIVDWIPAHFDYLSPNSIHKFDGSNLFGSEKTEWGTRFFDFSSPETRRLLEASAMWWLKEFHFDAIRVDAVSALVKRNGKDLTAGITFLQNLIDKVHTCCPGVLMIAESTDGDRRVTQPVKTGGFGFDLNWDTAACFVMRDYISTPENERSQKHHMLEETFTNRRGVNQKAITTHSHDDSDMSAERKPLYQLVTEYPPVDRLADIRNFFVWQILGPNWGHLIHMGDELAQPQSWCTRFKAKLSGVDWQCATQKAHASMMEFVKATIHYYKDNEDFWKQGGANYEKIYSYASNKIIAYARGANLIIHNFSKTDYPISAPYVIDIPERYKNLKETLNSDDSKYGGSGKYLNQRVTLVGKKLNLILPPLSAVVLKEVEVPSK